MARVHRLHFASLALLIALGVSACEGRTGTHAGPSSPPVVLLTAFEPFGGRPTNTSWEAIKDFEGTTIAGHVVRTALLPVVYDDMAKPLDDAIAASKPDAVVSFGEGREVIDVERVAKNGYHRSRPLDNAKKPPPRARIVETGKAEVATGLPAEAIVKALLDAKIQARTSDDAGGYLCNECFYRLVSRENAPARRGFVHVPVAGTKNPLGGTYTVDVLKNAVRVVVETTLATPEGRRAP